MSQKYAVGSAPIADAGPGAGGQDAVFSVSKTILSQYATSPALTTMIGLLAQAFDAASDVDAFYYTIWNVTTAKGFGLDILGRIVGVNRVLRIPLAVPFLGWQQQSQAQPFGFGIWYGGPVATQNYALTDDAFRRLILAKCALNICDGSIPAINSALLALFPERGNSHVRDNGGMSMTYVFGSDLSPVEMAIVSQAGVLPKPIGVSVGGEVAS